MSFEKADKEFKARFHSDKVYALNSIFDQAGHDVGALDSAYRTTEVTTEWLNPKLSALIGLSEMRETTFALMEEMRQQFELTVATVSDQVCQSADDADQKETGRPLKAIVNATVDALSMDKRAESIRCFVDTLMLNPTPFGLPVVVGPSGLPQGVEISARLQVRVPKQGLIQVDWFSFLGWLNWTYGGERGQMRMRQWAVAWLNARWNLMSAPFDVKSGKLTLSSAATYEVGGLHSLSYTFIAMKVFAEYVNSQSKLCPAELRSILAKASLYKGEPGVVFKAGGSVLVRFMKQEVRWTLTADLAETLREFVAAHHVPALKTKVPVFN